MFCDVRIHPVNDAVTRHNVAQFFGAFDGAVFIVHETEACRPHYQGIVWWPKTTQWLRDSIRKRFGVTGNKEYHVGEIRDYEKSVRYFCKGDKKGDGPDVVIMQSIDIDIKQQHEAYWEENKRLKKEGKDTGSTSVVATVLQNLKGFKIGDGYEGKRQVARAILDVLKIRDKPIQTYYVRGLVNTIMCKLSGDYESSMIEEIISKF